MNTVKPKRANTLWKQHMLMHREHPLQLNFCLLEVKKIPTSVRSVS